MRHQNRSVEVSFIRRIQNPVAKLLIATILFLDVPPFLGGQQAAQAAALITDHNKWVAIPVKTDPIMQHLHIPADAATRGMWSGVYNWPLIGLHVAVLPDGRILSYGSTTDGTGANGRYFDVWDSSKGFDSNSHITSYKAQQVDSFCSTASYLNDGSLMVTGGNDTKASTIYNWVNNSAVTASGMMAYDRWYGTMVTLPDSRKIIMGGTSSGNYEPPSITPEIYENGAWRSLFGASSNDAFGIDYGAYYPRAFVAPNGQVFGITSQKMWYLDPDANNGNGAITYLADFKRYTPDPADPANIGPLSSAVMYDIGKIFQAGAGAAQNYNSNMATVVDINNINPLITELPRMAYPRAYLNTTVLANGQIVVTGGSKSANQDGINAVYAAEIWNPEDNTWTIGANAAIYRGYHSAAALLTNGAILSTGGGIPGPVNNLNAEIYYPPYLFESVNGTSQLAARPVIKAISGLAYHHNSPIQMDMGNTDAIGALSLVGLSSTTHDFNNGQRRIPLTFTQDGYRLTATIPNSNLVPPGYYQVVAMNTKDVPSYATVIAIGADMAAPAISTTPYNPLVENTHINVPPSVSLTTPAANSAYTQGSTVNISANASDSDGSIAFVDFYDGNTYFGSATSAPYSFNWMTNTTTTVGTHKLTAMAYDNLGAVTTSTSIPITVNPTSSSGNDGSTSSPSVSTLPTASTAIAYEKRFGANNRIWVVNPDNDSVSVIDAATNNMIKSVSVGTAPRTLAFAPNGNVWVTNKDSATISVIDPTRLVVVQTIKLPRASQPYGLAFAPSGKSAYVVLEATGQLLKLDPATGNSIAILNVGSNPRHVSVNADSDTIMVSRFITPALPGESTASIDTSTAGGEVLVISADNLVIKKTIVLGYSNKGDTEVSGSGIPNYLAAVVISPDGKTAWVPSKQDNIKRGKARNGQPLNFQNTVRAISSRIDMTTLTEDLARRIDHDNSSIGSAAAYHPSGKHLFVALETSREVAVIDPATGIQRFRIKVGRAPQGLAISADGKTLYVQEFMDRSVAVVDLTKLIAEGAPITGTPNAEVTKVVYTVPFNQEKLPANVVLGKQLFYDAKDRRLSLDSYMSCASCHNDGGHDGRVWDLTGFGEGLRNTIALKGRAATGHGNLHWSANFDELQDFEGQIRALAGGLGLMSEDQFNIGTRNQPLGDKKAGVSVDLDNLAAYVASLNTFSQSPYGNADGTQTTAATAGKTVFGNSCASCHGGPNFTLSSDGNNLKNIGTLNTLSGKRLGGTLTGMDIPTLSDVWATAPYLHNGSASTITEAVQAHNNLTLNATELANVTAYLQEIDTQKTNGYYKLLSQGKVTIQSSTEFGGVSSRAVDGSTNGNYFNGSITHTASEMQPWWQVDLGQLSSLDVVQIWNRTDCCTDRLNNAIVFVSESDMSGRSLAQLQADPSVRQVLLSSLGSSPVVNLSLGGAIGRYVRVQLLGNNNLSLAEVQVFGMAVSNLSQGKSTKQSSTEFGGVSSRAVDGKTSGAWQDNSVTHTVNENEPWWQVDLGEILPIEAVQITNRTDCCSNRLQNFYVLASNDDMTGRTLTQLLDDPSVKSVYVASLNGLENISVQMTNDQARYIRIQEMGLGTLSLAEVKVFGGTTNRLTPSNVSPKVTITEPSSNITYAQGAPYVITAAASDSDGTVTRVDILYNGESLLSSLTSAPYSISGSTAEVPIGTYSITARAYDDKGAFTTSAPINVTVAPPMNNPPAVTITTPANNVALKQGAPYVISAAASDSDGTVTRVDILYNGESLLSSLTSAPYSISGSTAEVPIGTYSITARAYDDKGAFTTSAPINITVLPN